MPATKKAPAKKVAAKKAAAPAKKAPAKKAAAAPANDRAKLVATVVKRRNAGESVGAIAADLKLNSVTVNDLFIEGTVSRVKEAPTPARIKAGRDKESLSWKVLSVMYGITKAQVQKLYEEAGGNPRETTARKAAAPVTKKAAASSVPVVPKQTKPVFKEDAEKDSVIAKIDGKKITWLRKTDGQPEEAMVTGSLKVGKLKDETRVVQFTDEFGKARTVALLSIVKVGR